MTGLRSFDVRGLSSPAAGVVRGVLIPFFGVFDSPGLPSLFQIEWSGNSIKYHVNDCVEFPTVNPDVNQKVIWHNKKQKSLGSLCDVLDINDV